ncbi:MAG: MBL fold metallo-hydrolase, partial [Myxococcota bacterium]
MTFKIWSRFGKARLLAVVVIWAGVGWLSFEMTQVAEAARQASGQQGLVQLTDRAWAWVAPDERTANGALFVGDDAALLVDPGLTPDLARQFLAAAREATDRPIRFAVTTHGHLDHALGIACLSDRELEVVAHPKTRRSLAERGARIAALIAADAASPEERAELEACRLRLPDRTVPDREVIDLGGHRVEVFHPGVAHTHGDLIVWSPVEGVLATGDLFLRDASPYMGEGSAVGWKEALDRLVDLDAQHVIPGHFDVGSTEDLARFRDYISALIERVGAALAQGVAPEEAARRVDFPEFADFGQYPQYDATFEGNALAVARELALRPAERGEGAGFRVLTTVDVGQNPHQIDFTPDGEAAYIAAAGSDQVVRVDAQSYRVTETLAV